MAKNDMEKRKAAGPFMPKWLKVKNSYKSLKTGTLFKPDITPAINDYDKTLEDYDSLKEECDNLVKVVVEALKANDGACDEIADDTKQVADLAKKMQESVKKDGEQLRKYTSGGDVEPKEVAEALSDITGKGDEEINKRKEMWTEIDGLTYNNLQQFKKASAEYKSKADALTAKIDKLADTAYKCQTNIGQIIATYCDIARDADHEEIIKGLPSLGKEFSK